MSGFPLTPPSHPNRLRLVAARRALLERTAPERDSLPGRTWRAMAPAVRATVVMLACDAEGDPRTLALQPWESFNDGDRESMAACARMLQRELRAAECLL